MNSSSPHSSVRQLIDDYLFGNMTEEGFAELSEHLRSSKEHRDTFRGAAAVHAALHEYADQLHESEEFSGQESRRPDVLDTFLEPLLADADSELLKTHSPAKANAKSTFVEAPLTNQAATSRRQLIWPILTSVLAASLVAVLATQQWYRGFDDNRVSQSGEPTRPTADGDGDSNGELSRNSVQTISRQSTSSLVSLPMVGGEVSSPIAIIEREVGAKWSSAGDRETPQVGSAIYSGTLALGAGAIELRLLNGGSVVLEGPVQFQLIAADRAFLHHGRAFFRSNPLPNRFVIESRNAEYVNQNAEFGVFVSLPENIATSFKKSPHEEVHVFEGNVSFNTLENQKDLTSGAAQKFDETTLNWVSSQAERDQFLGPNDIQVLSGQMSENRELLWRKYRNQIRARDDVVLFYDFTKANSPSANLPNQASGQFDGTIDQCDWAEGRWDGKSSLKFDKVSSRIRFEIPDPFDEVTMMAWVRVEKIECRYNALMLTDEFETGNLHWQFYSHGKMDLGYKPPGGDRWISISDTVIGPDDLSHWIHMAVRFRAKDQSAHHFVNGQWIGESKRVLPVSTSSGRSKQEDYVIRIGKAELGNWSPAKAYDAWPVRNFNGCMDEFILFDRFLSDQDIQRLYVDSLCAPKLSH